MSQVPEHIEKKILDYVRADLAPSRITVYGKTGIATLIGGTLSLFFCGQFGIGITGFAQDFSHQIYGISGNIVCAVLCGSIFAIFPVMMLRILCGAMQFRFILRKKWQAPAIWFAVFGLLLSMHGEFGSEYIHFTTWLISSYLIYRLVGKLIDRFGFHINGLVNIYPN